jgi:hypothetical protein
MGDDFALALGAIGIVCVGLTAILLLHSKSPLRVSGDAHESPSGRQSG